MPSTAQLASRIYLKFDGTSASEQVTDAIISVEVDNSLTLPDMFAIHLRDPNLSMIDDDTFSLGSEVEISAKAESGSEVKILSGEITGIEPHLVRDIGPTLVLRGYDKSHRLNRGKKTRSFLQVTDSDIAKKIAQGASFRNKADSTREVHDYVLQNNQTDWEFLIERAQRVGVRVFVKDDTLHFQQFPDVGEQTPTLEWADNLLEFSARLTTAHQVSEVMVQGWDPDKQQQIVGSATRANDLPEIGESQQGSQAVESAFGGSAKEIIVDRPVFTQAEADALAQSICDEIGQGFVQAECVCIGNPAVQAGGMVELEGLGNRFSGSYRVTHALHRYDDSGYKTEFTVGGRHASTISELLFPIVDTGYKQGPVLGVVTNNEDPDDQCKVKVKIPSLKDSEESAWARIIALGAGKDRGFQWLPEVNDEVLVVFENNDINRPLVIGGLWSAKNTPPSPASACLDSDKVKTRQIVTRSGTKLVLVDDDNIITIANPDESFSLKISEKDSKIEIVSGGDISVEAQQNATVKTQGDVKVEATGNVSVQGQQVEIKASTSAKITSSANMNLEASGIMTIKGAQVKLN